MTTSDLPNIARQELNLFFLIDASGSMAADGKIQALNAAIREVLPHLENLTESNPHAELLIRAITFSSGAKWHIETPTSLDSLQWRDVTADGSTDLAAGIRLLASALTSKPLPLDALPIVLILISDGMPTDDYLSALTEFTHSSFGKTAVRIAIAIGRDADHEALARFMDGASPMSASNPEQLVRVLHRATMRATHVASELASPETLNQSLPQLWQEDASDPIW